MSGQAEEQEADNLLIRKRRKRRGNGVNGKIGQNARQYFRADEAAMERANGHFTPGLLEEDA